MRKINTSLTLILTSLKLSLIVTAFLICINSNLYSQKLRLNELDYFETAGLNVLVYSNQYNGFFFDEKTAGIELIHHGVRTATGGAVRLKPTPEQWDMIPLVMERRVNKENNSIEVLLRHDMYKFDSRVVVTAKDKGVTISVFLDKPLPKELVGNAGFNLEFLPATYFEKTFLIDGKAGTFPLYPSSQTTIQPLVKKIPQFAGHSTFDDRGRGEFIEPKPLVSGKTLILAPEDPERYVKIVSSYEDLSLYDGRNLAQNGWYVVRSLIPGNKTGKVVEWYLEPKAIENWKRIPNIGFSQVGYNPIQNKVAVIELDKNDTPLKTASLYQITPEGDYVEKFTSNIKQWGKYLRYNYVTFDFTSVKDPGLYVIKYGEQKTDPFQIGNDIYNDVWHPTLDVWLPVQMDHMMVNEAYRVWHGAPYLDDALQAPVNHQHFDNYKMGPKTDTKYKDLERIPGMAVGGWFDAGDFDIQTGTHCSAILNLVDIWERFKLDRDETFIDQKNRYVDIHHPDGKPDLLQQLEHGTLNVVAQVKNIGHPVRGIIVPNLHQYHHLGDAVTETDNLPYNPKLKPYESDGKSSGTLDDRWAFTNRMPYMDFYTIGALAASNRALQSYNKPLADECIIYAKKLWDEDREILEKADSADEAVWFGNNPRLIAALQLYITTKDEQYSKAFQKIIWTSLDENLMFSIATALQAYPYMDSEYRNKLRNYVVKFKNANDQLDIENPYGVPMQLFGWGGNSWIVNRAITNYYAHKAYPDIIGPEYVYKGLNYIYGCHPYSNVSFVSSVGTRSKKITYGNNRADFTFIAGGVVPGILMLKPDFPENKEDWPFLWGENEVVVDICVAYILLTNAVNELVRESK